MPDEVPLQPEDKDRAAGWRSLSTVPSFSKWKLIKSLFLHLGTGARQGTSGSEATLRLWPCNSLDSTHLKARLGLLAGLGHQADPAGLAGCALLLPEVLESVHTIVAIFMLCQCPMPGAEQGSSCASTTHPPPLSQPISHKG